MVEPMVGSIRVSRDFFDDEAFQSEKFSEREAFLWMIMEASFKQRERRVGSAVVTLDRGQLAHSTRFMAKVWQWPETTVRRFLDRLKKRRMVECATGAGVTVVTLCNYDLYQSEVRATGAETAQGPARQRRTTGANENKDAIREEREAEASLPRKRGNPKTRISPDALIPQQMRAAAEERGLSDAEAEAQFAKFRDWAVAKGQAYADWGAAWRNWLSSPYYAPVLGAVLPLKPEKADGRPSRSDQRLDAFLRGAAG